MGLTKLMRKTALKPKPVFIAEATFEKWEAKPAEDVETFTKDMIAKIKADHPAYRYVRSTFEYTHDGNIRFWFRFELKQFKGALSVTR